VQPNQIGPTFDLALGYLDPTTQFVKMIGYVVSPSGNSQEGTDVTDDSHLVQIGSPNSTDRFARFPQVSQGDWTKGERQRLYVEPAMYYLSDGNVDVSTPGNLTLFPGIRTDTIALTGQYNRLPLQTDGDTWYLGARTASGNMATGTGGAPVISNTMNGHEIYDLLYTPFALVAITDQGLWSFNNGLVPTSTHLVTETIHNPELPTKSLAYLDDNVYYLNNNLSAFPGCIIEAYDITTATRSVVHTTDHGEKWIQCMCSTANGLFFATTDSLPFQTFFYTWDVLNGGIPTRVAEVYGRAEYCFEALGTTYVICRQFQKSYRAAPAWTLYAIVGNQVTVVDDARWIGDPNFAPTCLSVDSFDNAGAVDFAPMLWTDGRFLYISWPGLATRRIDLVQGGISSIGPNTSSGQNSVHARRFITSATVPFIDMSGYGGSAVVSQMGQPASSGSLIASFVDLVSPGMGKIMRAVVFQTSKTLVGTQAVSMAFRLSQDASFTALTTQKVGTRNFIAAFPDDTKGTEVQLQITITADAGAGAPIVTSVTVVMDVGRVETYTLACRRDQQYRSQDQQSVDAQRYSGQDLWANLENIRNIGGGYGYAFIPDPTKSNGVDEIQIQILDIQKQTPTGAATGQRTVNGETDMERDVTVSFTEYFAPQ